MGIYTIVLENEVDLIVVTQNLRVFSHSISISRRELSAKVAAFRQLLLNPCSDPRPAGLELYNLLMQPIAQDLLGAHAKTLVWELEGPLHFCRQAPCMTAMVILQIATAMFYLP